MESGGEPGMNLSDLQGPQLPPAAAAAQRGQMSRPDRRLQGPARDKERSTLGTHFPPVCRYFLYSPSFPSTDSTSSQAPGCYFFPKTCGCSRRESGVPQDWSIRVEHLEKGERDTLEVGEAF